MSELHDLLLAPPLPDSWGRFLLFLTFLFHFVFVLILIGTAIIGNYHFLHSYWSQENFEHRWDKKMLKKFIIPKTLAVVLGMGSLLVMQLTFAVPFFTAIAFFAPYWLIAVPVMIAGFLMTDGISHKMEVHPIASAILGPLGMILVLAIPAVFVTVLVATENSAQWIELAQRKSQMGGSLIVHWLTRYLHVVGAALLFGAAFQYFVTSEGHDYRERALVRWMMVGLLAQFVSGGALALTLQEWLSSWVLLPLVVGIGAAAVPGVLVQNRENPAQGLRLDIRGFGTRAAFGVRGLKIFVDGIPLTLPDGQTSLDGFEAGDIPTRAATNSACAVTSPPCSNITCPSFASNLPTSWCAWRTAPAAFSTEMPDARTAWVRKPV